MSVAGDSRTTAALRGISEKWKHHPYTLFFIFGSIVWAAKTAGPRGVPSTLVPNPLEHHTPPQQPGHASPHRPSNTYRVEGSQLCTGESGGARGQQGERVRRRSPRKSDDVLTRAAAAYFRHVEPQRKTKNNIIVPLTRTAVSKIVQGVREQGRERDSERRNLKSQTKKKENQRTDGLRQGSNMGRRGYGRCPRGIDCTGVDPRVRRGSGAGRGLSGQCTKSATFSSNFCVSEGRPC